MTTISAKDAISYLFERPTEPIISPKGGDGSVIIDLPDSYYADERYKDISNRVSTTSSSMVVRIKELTNIPQNPLSASMPRNTNFSVFNDYHRSCASELIEIFLNATSVEDVVSLAAYYHDRVNRYLYIYALSVALLHRSDTTNIPLPSHMTTFPELYMDKAVLTQARQEENIIPAGSRIPITIPRDYTASDVDVEHKVAYFREDPGVNLHHWHWHLVYPLDSRRELVDKDRRGELFYYMHQQIIARYNMERLSNRLARVRRFVDFREEIPEGYYPKLDSLVASRVWPSRQPNSKFSNVNRETDQLQVDIQDLERWRDRIYEAIHTGRYLVTGSSTPVEFTVDTGIAVLGNMIESNILSVNLNEYGNLHNQGHNLISYIHDPINQNLESFGIMGDSSTAMRDPVFYAWHAFINDMFDRYKRTLPPYTTAQLTFENVEVTGISVQSENTTNANVFSTFWQQSDIDLSRGLDLAESAGSVYARITHLQHSEFTYTITVNNRGAARVGTVRIFFAPRYNEQGTTYLFRDQKGLFVELDRFTYSLRAGNNTITRRSSESSVTIPYEQTFRSLTDRPSTQGTAESEDYNFCGCGWPHHMLIAKGNTSGFACQLFVMISNNQNDTVTQTNTSTVTCDDASSFCGLRNQLYPDRQAMGFPFDRMPRSGVSTIQQFLTPNMRLQDVTIRFEERVASNPRNSGNATTTSTSSSTTTTSSRSGASTTSSRRS